MSQGRITQLDKSAISPLSHASTQMSMIGQCHRATQRAPPFFPLSPGLIWNVLASSGFKLAIKGALFCCATWESISWYFEGPSIFLPVCSPSSWELLLIICSDSSKKEQNISTKVSLCTSSSGSECSRNTLLVKKTWFPTGSWMIPCGACLNKCTVSSKAQLDPMSQPPPSGGTIGREGKACRCPENCMTTIESECDE